MARIEIAVEMKGIYSYEAASYAGYGCETHYIYNMVGEDGKVYVWKTTTFMVLEVEDENGWLTKRNGKTYSTSKINKGDKLVIAATVKGEGEYNGQPQTILTRVSVKERTFKAETFEERQARIAAEKAEKAKAQLESLQDGDFVWQMPYKQFKEHYADCETVVGSFLPVDHQVRRYAALITVIIRNGRLKASGVRGEHYSGYRLRNQDGEQVVYRAVKEENAIRRAEKEFGGVWTCIKVYEYDRERAFI